MVKKDFFLVAKHMPKKTQTPFAYFLNLIKHAA